MVTTHDESGTLLCKRSSQRSAKDKAGPISDLLLKLADNILAVKIQLLLLVNEYRHDAKAYLTGRPVNSPKWIPPGGCCGPASPTVPELKRPLFSWWTSHINPAEGTSVILFRTLRPANQQGLQAKPTALRWGRKDLLWQGPALKCF